MKSLLLVLLAAFSCDGGGASVNVDQQNDNRDDHQGLIPVPTGIVDCNRQCVRLNDGTWQVTIDCLGEPERTVIVGVLPPNCDSISEISPVVTPIPGSGFGTVL